MRHPATDPIAASTDPERNAARPSRRDGDEERRPTGVTAHQAPRPASDPAPSSSSLMELMDRTVARVLRITPQPAMGPKAAAMTSNRPFETPLLVSAVRCTLRYVVLPLVLPLVGVAAGATGGIVTGAALAILLALDMTAAIAIVATLRRLWRLQHPRRWQYLPVALTLAILAGIFLVNDTSVLTR